MPSSESDVSTIALDVLRRDRKATNWTGRGSIDRLDDAILWKAELAVHLQLGGVLAIGMPLAVVGATLLAHGATSSNALCMWLSFACFVCVGAVHLFGRRLARRELVAAARGRGLDEEFANRWTAAVLRNWLG